MGGRFNSCLSSDCPGSRALLLGCTPSPSRIDKPDQCLYTLAADRTPASVFHQLGVYRSGLHPAWKRSSSKGESTGATTGKIDSPVEHFSSTHKVLCLASRGVWRRVVRRLSRISGQGARTALTGRGSGQLCPADRSLMSLGQKHFVTRRNHSRRIPPSCAYYSDRKSVV